MQYVQECFLAGVQKQINNDCGTIILKEQGYSDKLKNSKYQKQNLLVGIGPVLMGKCHNFVIYM